MQEFTTTELKNEIAKVYNAVLQDGQAKITHRDRPPMILISEVELEKRIEDKK